MDAVNLIGAVHYERHQGQEWADRLVRVVEDAKPGTGFGVELGQITDPPIVVCSHARPATARAEALRLRQYLAALIERLQLRLPQDD